MFGPIARLRDLLSRTETLQSLVGATGDAAERQAAAAASVYYPAIHASDVADARPFVLIMGAAETRGEAVGLDTFQPGGQIVFGLEVDVPESLQANNTAAFAAAQRWFDELLGDLVADLLGAAVGGDDLMLSGYRVPEAPQRSDPTQQTDEGDFFRAFIEIDWGVES